MVGTADASPLIVEVMIMMKEQKLEEMTKAEAEAAVGIEPPCEDCVAVREQSAGNVTWCARHTKHHVRAHRHYEWPPSFALGSMLIRPAA